MNRKRSLYIILSATILFIIIILSVLYAFKWKYNSLFDFLYPTELQFYNCDEQISYVTFEGNRTAFLTESGEVYISGNTDENIGITQAEIRSYNHYGKFVKIVDNAKRVNLGKSGGVILDKQNQIYVFSNVVEGYKSLKKFEIKDISNIQDVFICHSYLFVFSEGGKLYGIDMNSDSEIKLLCDEVKQVNCENSSYLNIISQENNAIRLSMSTLDNTPQALFSSVKDFAFYNNNIYGYIDELGNAYIKYGDLNEEIKALKNAEQIVPYYEGIAVKDSDGSVWYFGRDVLLNEFYDGEKLSSNAEQIFSTSTGNNLCIIDEKGRLYFYGSAGYSAWGQGAKVEIRHFSEKPYCINP